MSRTNTCANPLVAIYKRGNYKLQAIFDAGIQAGRQQVLQHRCILPHDVLRDIALSSIGGDVSTSTAEALRSAGIRTIGDLADTTGTGLRQVKGIGPQTIAVLEHLLESLGFAPV